MLIKDWMATSMLTVDINTSVMRATRTMKENNIRRLPVLSHGKLVGVVTDRDLKDASPSSTSEMDLHEMYYLLSEMKIKDVMTDKCICLQKDDTLLLYTDGVTEADNINEEFFGDDRLKRLLADWQDSPVENLVDHIVATTHAFEGENRQADDITVLALHYSGQQTDDAQSFEIKIGNELADIELVIEKFMEFSSANGMSGKIANPVCMAFSISSIPDPLSDISITSVPVSISTLSCPSPPCMTTFISPS